MNYKDEMRKLIDLVKQQSFDAPLESTLDDMNMLTTAVSDLSDRITLRVSKSLQPNDKKAKASVKKIIGSGKAHAHKAKQIAVQSIKPQASI